MNAIGWLRWFWRQLTSMRTALLLLLLLALGSVPGSVIPQHSVDPFRVQEWKEANPALADVFERLQLFNVYGSPWFAAIYILLMVSLVGCIVPRLRAYLKALRARPPKAPKNLKRFAAYRSFEVSDDPATAMSLAAKALKRQRFRVDVADGSVNAERGFLREAGNLLFHTAILVVLVGFAAGSLWGYRGGAIIVEGEGFSNTLSQYDEFQAGGLFQPRSLEPMSFRVEDFDVSFITEGRAVGMAEKFVADVRYSAGAGSPEQQADLAVNHPLNINGTNIFLISHGYAPVITVRNTDGSVAYSGPTIFLPSDQSFRSFGVVKAPDAKKPLGLEGEFYPTFAFDPENGPYTAFPDALNPLISMVLWRGDPGSDTGSVYALNTQKMERVMKRPELQFRVDLGLGESAKLPDGMGSVSFDSMTRFVKLQVSRTPLQPVALGGVSAGLIGLILSLYIRQRRVWVRVSEQSGFTLVEVAGLDRSSGGDLADAIDDLAISLGLSLLDSKESAT